MASVKVDHVWIEGTDADIAVQRRKQQLEDWFRQHPYCRPSDVLLVPNIVRGYLRGCYIAFVEPDSTPFRGDAPAKK
ncbi:MAG TPA: hypothetical protein VFQ60_03395 [Patescibacteria group bacterium]|nr:hypothetical protein [Patescibacteria group bacterium]